MVNSDLIVKNTSKSNKLKTFFICLYGLIGFLLLVGMVLYALRITPSKKIFLSKIKKTINSISLNGDIESSLTKIDFSSDFEETNGDSILNFLNAIDLHIDINLNAKNEKSLIKFTTNYYEGPMLNGVVYSNNNNTYFYSENIFNRYIQLDNKENIANRTIYYLQNCSKINNFLQKALENALKKEYFVKNNDKNPVSHSLVLSDLRIANIKKYVASSIIKDKSMVENFAIIFNTTAEEVNNYLDGLINFNIKDYDNKEKYEIVVYTNGILNKLDHFEIKNLVNNKNIVIMIGNNISIKCYENDKNYRNYNIKITSKSNSNTFIIDVMEDNIKGTITLRYSSSNNNKIDAININNLVKESELTVTDKNTITRNLHIKQGVIDLFNILKEINIDLPFSPEDNEKINFEIESLYLVNAIDDYINDNNIDIRTKKKICLNVKSLIEGYYLDSFLRNNNGKIMVEYNGNELIYTIYYSNGKYYIDGQLSTEINAKKGNISVSNKC